MRPVIIMWFWLCLAVALQLDSRADQAEQAMSRQEQLQQLRLQQMKNDAEFQAQRNQSAAQPNQVSGQSQPNMPSTGRHSAQGIQERNEERQLMYEKSRRDAELQQKQLQMWAEQQKVDAQKIEAEKQKYDENMIGTYYTETWQQDEWFTTLPKNIQDNYIAAYKNGYVNDRDMSYSSNLEIINHEIVQSRGMEEYAALIRGQASFPPKPHRREDMERRKNAPPPVALTTSQAESSVFPEPIMGFTLGTTINDFRTLVQNNNYQIADLDYDSSHLMGIMGGNQHRSPLDDGYWLPSGIPRPFARNSRPNCVFYQVNAAFVNTLGATRYEVGFLEGRMVGLAVVYQTGSGYISALYEKIRAKYPMLASNVTDTQLPMSKPEPSALLDMKGHPFLIIQTSFSVSILNIPLIENIKGIQSDEQQRRNQQRQNEINRNLDSVI